MRKYLIITVAAVFFLLVTLALWPPPTDPFAKYVCSSVPKSVRMVLFESNDRFGIHAEPVCYLAFTASADDLAALVRQGAFKPTSPAKDAVPVPSGPTGWLAADQVGPNGNVYTRAHRRRPGPPIGMNRAWTEFLWIDGTGTNAYFLVWGV